MPLPPGQRERRASSADAALANNDRLAKLIKIVGILLAVYVAIAVTAASVIGIVNSFSANEHAKEGERYALEARNAALTNTGIAGNIQSLLKDVETLVAQQSPCLEEDPLTKPACQRKVASEKIVNDAIADIVAGIDTHDLNAKAAHDKLLAQQDKTPTTRVPVTPRSRTSTTAVAAATTPRASPTPPPVITTTCPPKGKSGQCQENKSRTKGKD